MKKIRNIILLFGMLVISMQSINAQDFSGYWEGKLTVSANGNNVELPYKMVIKTDDNGNCAGLTALWITMDGKTYFSKYKFTGTYSGSTLNFTDGELMESNNPDDPNFYWCTKSGALKLNGKVLTGDITGYSPKGGCLPATAYLTFHSALQ